MITMKYWPVPDSYSKKIPTNGNPGSFWENRGDRYHCGIDIYAPYKSHVLSIDDGVVVETGTFTSSKEVYYWNETKHVVIKNKDGLYIKYAELYDVFVKVNDTVRAGQKIAIVGNVLDLKKIDDTAPSYILDLKKQKKQSMLHIELYISLPIKDKKYLGGNWFGKRKIKILLDPAKILRK